jgi:PAS domain S-box-containing protein
MGVERSQQQSNATPSSTETASGAHAPSSAAALEPAPTKTVRSDQLRRASAARAMAAVFAAILLLALPAALHLRGVSTFIAIELATFVAFVACFWIAGTPSRASQAGAALIATMVAQQASLSMILVEPADAVLLAYCTSFCPLVAAATLRARGAVAAGVVGALTLAFQVFLHAGSHPGALESFLPPVGYYLAAWALSAFSSIAANRALDAQAQEERIAQETEARYRLVAEHMSDLISLVDETGQYLYASPSFQRVLGIDPSQLIGNRVGRFNPNVVHPADQPTLQRAFAKVLQAGSAKAVLRVLDAAGEYRSFHTELLRLSARAGSAPAIALSARDITEERRLSLALESTRRMEALGRLAAGVAHDFNNLLFVIQSCSDFIAGGVIPGHPAQLDLDKLRGAVQRASSLTAQLLTFARLQVLQSEGQTIAAHTARELSPILERLCGPNIRFELVTHDSQLAVDASATQFEQILMNLAANARDAMPQGGTLRVELRERTLSTGEVVELDPGRYAELTVADSGVGMSSEVQARIFEPFFTTKATGKGTGLGLATVYGLVSQLHGHIAVHSAPGSGTTFTVYLPEAHEQPARTLDPQPLEGDARPLEILVVDDEAGVRDLMARILAGAGHHITEADSAAAAFRAVEGARFDAIVTDVVLRADDGISMLEQIKGRLPEAAIVVVSGFTPSPGRVAELQVRGAEFLAKPFSATALLGALARARARASV